jgi:hypothetical protein
MARERLADERACLNIKNTNHIVLRPSCDPFRIWGPVDDPHVSTMALQDVELALSGRDIPYSGGVIVTCGREVASIGRICQPAYLKQVQ